jgi:hypothetical protein
MFAVPLHLLLPDSLCLIYFAVCEILISWLPLQDTAALGGDEATQKPADSNGVGRCEAGVRMLRF